MALESLRGLAAEPIDGHHGTIAVELDDDRRIKVQQKLGKEIGGYLILIDGVLGMSEAHRF
jgi:hypothetical protein